MNKDLAFEQQKRPTVLVTDADRGSSIAIIRSLGRRGWRVIAADSDPRSVGFRSRYVEARVVYPPPRTAPNEFVDRLYRTVQDNDVDLVIPITDEAIHPLSHVRERFERLCHLALAEPTSLEIVTDKAKTLDLAGRLGVPTPRSELVETVEEALEAARTLSWPVVLKPAVSRHYIPQEGVIAACPVSYANSLEELTRRMRPLEGGRGVLLQEYFAGIGQGVEMLAHRGRVLAAFQHKRLAEIPVSGGASAWRESVPLDPVLYDYARRLVEALAWTGLIMVEFKVGEGVRLMEINGRIWGSLPLAVLSGMDFPARLAELYVSQPPPEDAVPVSEYRVGVRAFNLELTILWILQVLLGKRRFSFLPLPRRREAVAAAMGLLSPKQKLDIASRDDPGPGLAEIAKIARNFGRRLKNSIAPGSGKTGRVTSEASSR